MKIFVTGATGFVGTYLTKNLRQMGHELTIVSRSSRSAEKMPSGITVVQGDPTRPGSWQQIVKDHDAAINLAGASIFTLWTSKARETIMSSRILTTRNLVDALASPKGETVLISTSAVGYYGGRDDDRLLDESSPAGHDFLAQVGENWEAEAMRAEDFGVRVVTCRFGIVFGRGGGALTRMVPAFKDYLGSALGSGKQWFPWIHEKDLLNIMLFAMETRQLKGPVNCVAPNPVTNAELTRTLAQVLGKRLIMPAVPRFVLRTLLGEFGDVLLKGQRAIPKRLLDEGFQFQFPHLREALEDLLA